MSYDICPACSKPTFRCGCSRDRKHGEGPIQPELIEQMNQLARFLDGQINGDERPKKYGFTLMVFDFGSGGYMNYISNADRNQILQSMREFIDRNLQQN